MTIGEALKSIQLQGERLRTSARACDGLTIDEVARIAGCTIVEHADRETLKDALRREQWTVRLTMRGRLWSFDPEACAAYWRT